MPSPLAEAFLMGILNGCYETPSKLVTLPGRATATRHECFLVDTRGAFQPPLLLRSEI